jgi:hypothetical protein
MSRGSRLFPSRPGLAFAVAITSIAACQSATPALSPEGLAVQVSDHPAPPSARPLGPVTATSGRGCGLSGEEGTRERALALLREEVASEGGDYVQITSMVTPHLENGCYANQIVLRGQAWRAAPGPVPETAAASAPAAAAPPACDPPCGAGYACASGACRAVCSPPCGPNEDCGQDRVCRPAPRAPVSPDAGSPDAPR